MTMDVSSLGIQVQSTGIKEASSALTGLGTAAANAEAKVTKLTDAVERLLKMNVPATMQAWTSAIQSMSNAMNAGNSGAQGYAMALTNGSNAAQQASTVTNTLNQQFNAQINILNNLTQTTNNYAAATNRAATETSGWLSRAGVMVNTLKAMTTAYLYYTAIDIGKSIVTDADKWTLLNTKMIAATGSQNNATVAMESAFEIANKLSVPLDATIKLYSRLAPAMSQMGFQSAQTNAVVLGLSSALRLGGASTAEANAAMTQFSHAMSAGSFNAREYNSLTREAPLLLRAMANQMTGGNLAALKALMGQSKVTAKETLDAITAAQPAWDKMLAEMPVTFEGAMQRLKNTWLKSIGEMAMDTNFNSNLAQGVKILQDMIPGIVQSLGNAFAATMKWIDANKDNLGEIWKQVKGIVTDVIAVGVDMSKWVGAAIGAGESFSLVAEIIFSIRLGFAAIKDGIAAIGAVIVTVGANWAESWLSPIEWVISAIAKMAVYVGKLYDVGAAGAKLAGDKAAQKAYEDQAQSARDFAYEALNLNTKMNQTIQGAKDMAAGWVNTIADGKGAIDTLLNSASKTDEKIAKLKKKYDENANPNPTAPEDKKMAAAQQKDWNKYQEAIASLSTEYDKLLQTQANLTAGPNALKVGPAQTEYLRLQNEILAAEKKKGDLAQQNEILYLKDEVARAGRNAAMEIENEIIQKNLDLQKKQIDQANTMAKTIEGQADAMESKLTNKISGKGAGPEGKLIGLQDQLATAQAGVKDAQDDSFTSPAELAGLNAYVTALEATVAAQNRLVVATKAYAQQSAQEKLDKLLDPARAQKFGDTLTKAFGAAGKAMGGLLDSYINYSKEMDKVAAAQTALNESGLKGQDAAKAQAEIDLMNTQARMKNYADMAQAAEGFFKKGTEGYKIMSDVDKAFRIAEAASALENFLMKSGLLTAFTGLFVTQQAAQGGAALAGTVPVVAAEGVKQTAYATSALAASLTLPPPVSFATFAITAALLAGIGILVAGANHGGTGVTAQQQQAAQGTGTVLGDTTKQSQSIQDSLKALQSNSNIDLKYSSEMVMSLANIEAALTGVTNAIISGNGSITGANFKSSSTGFSKFTADGLGYAHGTNPLDGVLVSVTNTLNKMMGGALSKLAGVSTKTSLVDSGITSGNQSIGNILSHGFQGSAYQTVDTTSKALFGLVSNTKTSTSNKALDSGIASAFTDVIKSMVSTVTSAAKGLGVDAATVAKQLDGVTVSLGNISLKGLTADQIKTQLNAVFSSFGDKLVTAALGPLLTGFQQAGEGLLQTAVRVAGGVDEANAELSKLGMTAINFADVVNKSGDVAAEIVRQTILLKEAGSGLGDIISTMSDTAANIGDTYISLLSVRRGLQDLGIAKDVAANLLAAAGGLSALQSSLDDYKKNFFTAAQQQAMSLHDVTQQFAALGLSMPATKDAFVALVNQLSASGTAGQELATKVIGLSGAFSSLYSSVDSAVSSATSDLTAAYNNQVSAINTTKTAFDGFAASLKTFKQSLMTGDLSTSSGLQKYQAGKALYEQTQTAAMKGDQNAISQFQQVAQDFLTASRAVNASGSQYTADYNEVLSQTDSLQQFSAGQSSIQDQQLTALNQQVSGLITINSSVLTVAQAIANLQAVMAQGLGTNGFSFNGTPVTTTYSGGATSPAETIMPVSPTANGSHAAGLGMVPFDGYLAQLHKGERVLTAQEAKAYQQGNSDNAVLAELQSLKATVASLRDGQREQTGALVAATYDSNAQNADAIVQGQKDATKEATYNQRAKANLV